MTRTKPRQAGSPATLDRIEKALTEQLIATQLLFHALWRLRATIQKAERR